MPSFPTQSKNASPAAAAISEAVAGTRNIRFTDVSGSMRSYSATPTQTA